MLFGSRPTRQAFDSAGFLTRQAFSLERVADCDFAATLRGS
ncbi:hypothetical protein RSSM_04916 [Rhodopirellula sallentina SM41]|uniref:Uncharacterized protein n=1 Tax=Rhodopirellula sallentina SM41 TaxID=1263870 RepID=M5TX89_9BACT|nr:hypothetical protein RSSM_04916 [Rhodopirellula sallentina SM41]